MKQNTMEYQTVISLDKAAKMLPIRNKDARRWLEEFELVRYLYGKPVVIWKEVLDVLSQCTDPNRSKEKMAAKRKPKKSRLLN